MKRLILLFGLVLFNSMLYAQSKEDTGLILRKIRNQASSIKCDDCTAKRDSIILLINVALVNLDITKQQVPLKFVNDLDNWVKLFKIVVNKDDTIKHRLLNSVLKDFNIKFGKAPDHLSNESFFKLVEVKIIAKNNSSPVNNLSVYYSGLGYAPNYNNPFYSFSSNTSPATEFMVPGFYRIWITDSKTKIVLGEKKIEIDPAKTNTYSIHVNK